MRIDLGELLRSVDALRSPGTRIGLPDEPASVDVPDPSALADRLDAALRAFRELRGPGDFLVDADTNQGQRAYWIRFVLGRGILSDGTTESALEEPFGRLNDELTRCGGKLGYWGGNGFLNVSLPFRASVGGSTRENFPETGQLPWYDRYRVLLERESWEWLRKRVYRFSQLSESFAAR